MAILSVEMRGALSAQYAHETANGIKYAYREAWSRYRGFTGCADYFASQAKGERHHAKLVLEYIQVRGEELQSLAIPSEEYPIKTFTDAFQSAYDLELGTTEAIRGLFELATEQGDMQTLAWLLGEDGLINIQTTEEDEAKTILDRITSGLNGLAPDADPSDTGLLWLEIDRFVGKLVD